MSFFTDLFFVIFFGGDLIYLSRCRKNWPGLFLDLVLSTFFFLVERGEDCGIKKEEEMGTQMIYPKLYSHIDIPDTGLRKKEARLRINVMNTLTINLLLPSP